MKKWFTLIEMLTIITIFSILWISIYHILSDNNKIDEDCVMNNIEDIKQYVKDCQSVWLYNCKQKAYEEYRCYENY